MEIEIFTLCDYAQEWNGKLFINGTFDMINARNFPTIIPACTIAGKLRFSTKESGLHFLKLKVVDPSGKDLIKPIEGEINVPNVAQNADYSSIHLAFNMQQMKLEMPGTYTIQLFIDEEWVSGLKLIAVHQPN